MSQLYPFFRNPFTDLSGFMFNAQVNGDDQCAKMEMKLYDCLEAYGLDMGNSKCAAFAKDYQECTYRFKEDRRTLRMQYERHRQYLMGERSERFEKPPKFHSL